MPYIIFCISFIYITLFVSSIMCISTRLANNCPVTFSRSQCDQCAQRLRWWQLIPCLGWLLQLGRCPDCHQPVSFIYPLAESSVGLLGALIIHFNPFNAAISLIVFNLVLLALACQDAAHLSISAWPIVTLLVLALIHQQFSWLKLLMVTTMYLASLYFIHQFRVMGNGDVDCIAVLSLMFPVQVTIASILFASLIALTHFYLSQQRPSRLPFIPYLFSGLIIVQLYAFI
ncbi:prepilin [Furfurilactobacillus rossiae]|uniref:prepilin peptidase n=1 Tax=Furfurilactobacillus rossiae TaxID=231049 RepID=UPI0015C02E80|nr:A24 family peptidase [Furfurilactobacillus rossiae]MCF6165250.1 prepilin peptidase [Furfurilactobacillus rossiae]QLE63610.1 prepilin [Furfurilactobacillus rossiae]